MNIYQKLAKARVELQDLKLKKSGNNTYSNFTYYELGDFLPAINAICLKNGLYTHFNIVSDYDVEKAILTVYNSDEPTELLTFISKTAEVEIGKTKDGTGGANPIQNLGGKITYMRRYMFIMAFEIVESDSVDAINLELAETSSMSQEDIDKVNEAKSLKELTKLFMQMKGKYKQSLMTPIFSKKRVELEQTKSEA